MKKRKIQHLFALLIFLLTSLHGSSQVLRVIDSTSGYNTADYMLRDFDQNLVVIRVNKPAYRIEIRTYSDNQWIDHPSIHLDGSKDLSGKVKGVFYQNELYVCYGMEWDSSKKVNFNGFARLHNGAWESIGTENLTFSSVDWENGLNISIYKDKLLLSGSFDSLNDDELISDLITWDGQSLGPLTLNVLPKANSIFRTSQNEYIYFGSDGGIVSVYKNQIFVDTLFGQFLSDDDEHIFFTSTFNYSVKDTTLTQVSDIGNIDQEYWTYDNGVFWCYHPAGPSTVFKDNFTGPGLNNSAGLSRFTLIKAIDRFIYVCTENLKLYKIGLYNYGTLEGRCFLDLDSNCRYTAKDIPITSKIVSDSTGYHTGITDKDGRFKIIFDTEGEFTIQPPTVENTQFTCTTSKIFNANAEDSTSFADFAYEFDPDADQDIGGDLTSSITQRGRWSLLNIRLTNHFWIHRDSIDVAITADPRISNFKFPVAHTQNGNSYRFKIPSPRGFFQSSNLTIPFLVDKNRLNIDDEIVFLLDVLTVDSTRGNNLDTLTKIVRAPHDPNTKESYPHGVITKPIDKIEYTIQFQNVGTSKAINVIIVDTVDTRLPLRYLKITGTSHPNTYDLRVRNNVLTWTFKGINLPDSNTNAIGSKGFVTYEARIKDGFSTVGDQIDNKAYIYFDYEDPIETNIASVQLEDTLTSIRIPATINHLLIYPNPFNSSLTFKNDQPIDDVVYVFDGLGREITHVKLSAYQSKEISTNAFSIGLYFIKTNSGSYGKVIKVH